jgi:hypothetical protein
MKYLICAILILLLFADFSYPLKRERRILFIGSYQAPDMPQILQKMFDEQRLNIKVDQLNPFVMDLAMHATSVWNPLTANSYSASLAEKNQTPTTIKKILSEKWDMVVLKEVTGNTLIPAISTYVSEPAIRILDSVVKRVNSKTVLFESHSDYYYPDQQCFPKGIFSECSKRFPIPIMQTKDNYCSDSFRNSKEEFHAIETSCNQLAKKIKAGIVRVGFVWELCKKQYPEIPLYESKYNDRPSKQGSYLIACVFYRYITKLKVGNVKYSAGIDELQAKEIKKLVDASL